MELEYGKWATYAGKRYMITDWTDEDVQLFREQGGFWVGRKHVTDVSDFKQTDAERKALGYAF
jgi:hypothetical protein